MSLAFPVAAAAALVQAAPAFDAYRYRSAQPAAFAAELGRLRAEWTEMPTRFDQGERLALLMLAENARSAGDFRRAVAELAAWRAGVRRDVEEALAGRYRTEWLNGRWLNNAARTRDPEAKELFRRVFADQYQLQVPEPPSLGPAAAARLSPDVRALAADNARWLRSVLARIGWFDISRYGAEASQAAWLIVQHSDHDPAWQVEVLEALRPRVARGDMQPSYFAYLVDRVAVNAGTAADLRHAGPVHGPRRLAAARPGRCRTSRPAAHGGGPRAHRRISRPLHCEGAH
jgi:hypothetical protein